MTFITDLSRYSELFVIARHSSFVYRDQQCSIGEIAQDLGVQYILEGNVRRAVKRVRVTAQLTDASGGNHIWAERYDRDLVDIFAVQDEITGMIVNTLAGQLTRRHYRRVLSRHPDAVDAYDHALRAMELILKVGQRDTLLARAEAQQAVAIDPRFARAHALIAWAHVSEGSNHWGENPTKSFQRGYEAAVAAVAADNREPWAHAALAWVYIWRDRAHDRGIAELNQALMLNPSNAHFRSMLAWGLGWAGQAEASLIEMETAMRLNPHYPILYLVFLGRALFLLRRYDEALPHLQRVATEMPDHANALALVAACYAALHQITAARATVQAIVQASPGYTLEYVRERLPYAKSEDLEDFCEMLRLAGLPE